MTEQIVTKVLTKIEVLKGFIHIPVKNRNELIGDLSPSTVLLNGEHARLDSYGRIWSPSLKNRFSIGTQIKIERTEKGFVAAPTDIDKNDITIGLLQGTKTDILSREHNRDSVGHSQPSSVVEPFFSFNSICIYNDDFLITSAIKENTIDLVVTSPPYNVDIQYENYRDDVPYDEYLYFTEKWLTKCFTLMKDDGRLCLNVPLDKNKGGQQSVCADITTIAKRVGWKYHATIIWNEQNISRRTAWGSWMSASAPFVIAPVEMILVLYKKTWQKRNGSRKSDITRHEFISWTNGVWDFSGESRNKIGHPAPFPVELPRRCIKLFSFVGDIVLDPFLGSGTTLIACLQAARSGIGIEINKNYCELAKKRLEAQGIYQKKLVEPL